MQANKLRGSALRVALLLALSASGCVTPEAWRISPDAPVLLHPEATTLRGQAPESLVVLAETTVVDVPLTTGLVRRGAEEAGASVVSLYLKTSTPARVRLLPIRVPGVGIPVRLPGQALGSGFFVHPSGLLLTNEHVVADATSIAGMMADGTELRLVVIARDPVYDLALLRPVGSQRGSYPALPMGDDSEIGPGDFTIAIGNPLGLGDTVTLGIVSQTGRELQGVDPEVGREIRFIQTDAAINPGSSGGPLVTLSGAWVGVTAAGAAKAQGINFAVPAEQVLEFLSSVVEGRGEAAP